MIKLSLIIILFITLNFPGTAQFSLNTGYQGIFDDNIHNNYEAVSDFINVFSIGSAFDLESEFNNVQIYYEGSLNTFRTNTSKSFNTHRIGLVETHLFTSDENPLNAGLNYSFRNNKDDYIIYDFDQVSVYLNYRYGLSSADFITPGYLFNVNSYKNFTIFSNYEHRLFLAWSSSLETKTSINIRAEGNLKYYTEKYDYPGYLNEAALLKFMVNVGQSLNEQTGINLYVSFQKDLSEGSRYILDDSLIYYEEEIFNDVYAYTGYETGIGFRHYFNKNLRLNAEAKYLKRMYSSLPAVDFYGSEEEYLREDDMIALGVGVEYNLNSIIEGLSLSGFVNYFNNSSNDYFYKYKNNVFSFSLDYGF